MTQNFVFRMKRRPVSENAVTHSVSCDFVHTSGALDHRSLASDPPEESPSNITRGVPYFMMIRGGYTDTRDGNCA